MSDRLNLAGHVHVGWSADDHMNEPLTVIVREENQCSAIKDLAVRATADM
ncbi:hypothetical protein ALC56_14039 [Trachymyrmex septentrionalis]|uniref:Uncharacterized protein n=1 Tax=Trachymyrmex septentrionalis TaxID=34720 RepID=A0A151JT43_9HYME|nr:hypothetical protein ALC56_14039 [Trachymyrmex septentrionalis]